jgi:hypothetical protein
VARVNPSKPTKPIAYGCTTSGGRKTRHLVIGFRVARKPNCIGFIRDFKGKRLVVGN